MASDSLQNEITVESNNAEDNPPASSNCASSNGDENDRTAEKPNGLENDETDSTPDNNSIYSKNKSVEEYSKDHLVNVEQQDKVEESYLPSSDLENDETDSTLDNNINVSKRKSLEDCAEDYTVNGDEEGEVEESCLPSNPSHQISLTENNSVDREYIVSKSERDEGEYGRRVEQTETFDKDSEFEEEPHSSDNDEYTSKVSTGLRTLCKPNHENGVYQIKELDKCREESHQRELSSKSEIDVSKEESCVLNRSLSRPKESKLEEVQNLNSNLEQIAFDEEINVQL